MRGFIGSIHVWLSHLPGVNLNTTIKKFSGQMTQLYAYVADESKGPKEMFTWRWGTPGR